MNTNPMPNTLHLMLRIPVRKTDSTFRHDAEIILSHILRSFTLVIIPTNYPLPIPLRQRENDGQ